MTIGMDTHIAQCAFKLNGMPVKVSTTAGAAGVRGRWSYNYTDGTKV